MNLLANQHLSRAGVLTKADVRNFCRKSSQPLQKPFAGIVKTTRCVKCLVLTFNYFARVMRKSTKVIPWNTRMELNRYKTMNHHVKRNQMRSKDAVYTNAKQVNILNILLHHHRKKFEQKKTR